MKASPDAPCFPWSLEGEEWRPAMEPHNLGRRPLLGFYVSNHGRLCNDRRLLKASVGTAGLRVAHFGLGSNGKQRVRPVGRVILATWKGAPPSPNLATLYLDGDHDNLRPENLVWGRHVSASPFGGWYWQAY